MDYLDAGLNLPLDVRRIIGREKMLYGYYLLNGETFDGCRSGADLETALARNAGQLERRIAEKHRQDFFAGVIEHVSDALAVRAPDYAGGLDPETVAKFDAEPNRRNYLIIQENLCDLRLGERRGIGEGFVRLRERVAAEGWDLGYRSFFSDGKSDFLYVLAVARGLDRAEILRRAQILLLGGLAQRGKKEGMIIVDRDGMGYEVMQIAVPSHTAEAVAAGDALFAKLKITDTPIRLLPDGG